MLNKNNLSGYLSIIIRLFNIGLIFYISLTIPTYLSVNQYAYYAKYFASISLISILIMGGLPNFLLRIKNRMNMNGMSNHSIRINIYPIQIIFAFILSILFFGSEINFRNESYNFLVLLGTATLITFIRFEKSLLVADGRGLISQISEMIIYPIFFL